MTSGVKYGKMMAEFGVVFFATPFSHSAGLSRVAGAKWERMNMNNMKGERQVIKIMTIMVTIVVFCSTAWAADLGPEAPMLIKQGLSVNGMYSPEAAGASAFSMNPSAVVLTLEEYKVRFGIEQDYGKIRFDQGPDFTSSIQSYVMAGKWGGLRISHFDLSSNTQPTVAAGDMPVRGGAEALELVYGKRVSDRWLLGAAVVPRDKVNLDILLPGLTLMDGHGESKAQMRFGALYQPSGKSGKWNLGAVYSYEKDNTQVNLQMPTETGDIVASSETGSYLTRSLTYGLAYRPQLGTTVMLGWQKGSIRGTGFRETLNSKYYGVEQFLNQNISLRIGSTDGSQDASINYYKGHWNVGLSYSKDAYSRLEQYFGHANVGYLWVAYTEQR